MKRECLLKAKFSASVSNGWSKIFEVKCGAYGDGIIRKCKKCN